jgi:polar amino acid transport system substrate-binding protein
MKRALRLFLLCLSMVTILTSCGKQETVINSIDDAKEKRIGVMTGSIGETLAHSRFPKAEIKSFDDIMDAVAAIKSGQLDVIITMFPAALQVAKKNPDLRILPERLENEDTAVAIKKEDTALQADVDRVISELKADGTLESMHKRWLKTDLSPYEELTLALPKEGKPLKIGVSATREPFSFVDENGRVTGFDGELARLIGVGLQRPVEFFNMKFMALIPALQSGKVDLIISGMNATPERRKSVAFSQTYFANAQVMLARKPTGAVEQTAAASMSASTSTADGSDELAKIQQAEGKRIGVMTGTTSEATAIIKFPKADIKRFDDITSAITAMKSGQADAVIQPFSSAVLVTKKHPDLHSLPDQLYIEDIAIAIRKGNSHLLNEVNSSIAALKNDGTLASMKKRWLKEDTTPYEEINITVPQSGNVLKIGVSAVLEPFIFIDASGKITGHDIELARRIAAKLKRPVEIVDMKFMALIPALQSGKIDMIVSSMTATDERRKSVDFSQPYFADAQVLTTKKAAAAQTVVPPASDTVSPGEVISELRHINGKRVGVLTGSAGDHAARKRFPNASIMDMNASADAALAIKSNKADAFVYDKSVLLNLAEKNPELVILEEPVAKLEVAAAIKKDNKALLADMNRVLSDLKKDGTLQRLQKKWIESKDGAQRQLPPTATTPVKGVLRLGTSAIIEPFSYQANGKIIGLDIELGNLIGERLGKRVEIFDMQFESLIPALHSGKIDFAMSNFNVTEERKKLVNFSLPYIENDISALVRRGKTSDAATTSPKPIIAGVPDGTAAETRLTAPTFLQGVAESFQSNIITEKRYLLIWDGLRVTFLISILSSIFGTLLGALVCYMRMSKSFLLNQPAKIYISVLRGTPVLVLLMLIFYVAFASININPVLVAVIAFGMNFAAYAAEIFRAGIENVDKGQTEAGIAMGFTKVNTFLFIVLPQAVRQILPVYKGEFISLVKMTSIVGYIAVQDLTKASDIIRSRTFDAFFPLFMVAILYFLISWILTQSLEYLERATDPKRRRKQAGKA